jgi:general secretion pathway protein D
MPAYFFCRIASLPLAALLLAGCATEPSLLPEALTWKRSSAELVQPTYQGQEVTASVVTVTPKPPVLAKMDTFAVAAKSGAAANEKADITLMFDQLPLPNFIQVVYGNILKASFSVDAQVSARTDLVTLRTAQPQTATQIRETARMLLKSYGVAVTDVGNLLRIVPDNTLQGYAPEIRRGRALPETPLPLRPIFQLVELDAVSANDVGMWIVKIFGQKVSAVEDPQRNALLVSGQSDDVAAALETIRILDQPRMRGNNSVRISPMFWSADEMSKKLNEILTSEGYRVGTPGSLFTPVIVLPIQAINAVMVFSGDPEIVQHVVKWAKELDKPSSKGGGYFTYAARFTDGQELAKTIRELMSGAPAPAGAAGAAQAGKSRVVVNPATNTLIFQGGMEDYTSILNLLQELDQPAKAALIEVTVAEVNLTDAQQLGVEWAMDSSNGGSAIWTGGTLGGLGVGKGGLTLNGFNAAGSPRMVINALANNNRARILSSPRVMARNGETATIQVGQEVPVITSQQTSPTTGGTGGILQSVQYRNTGVILKVKPIIHAGSRIELEVSQEVSSAAATSTGVTTSPTISTRRVDTKLSLRDGATVLLGGLMSSNTSKGDVGIPLLKDIPGIGQLFRVNNDTSTKTELMILITPYIISDDKDAQAITDAFRERLGDWAKPSALTTPVKPVAVAAPANAAPGSAAPPTPDKPATQPAADAASAPALPTAPAKP